MKLRKYRVPITLIVYGEREEDAWEYVEEAIDKSNLLDQDGILGIDDTETDLEDIEELEE